jgi:Putative bacterial sensory transduction regulator
MERISMQRPNLLLLLCLFFLPIGNAWSQSTVYTQINDQTVEKVLTGLEIKFKKDERKLKDSSIAFYEFERSERTYRLYNYRSDLWIECLFDKSIKLDDVNRWNAEAKFSRAVLLDQKDKSVVSLEAQLDCLGGVTDAMITQFVNRFDEEGKKFVKTFPK